MLRLLKSIKCPTPKPILFFNVNSTLSLCPIQIPRPTVVHSFKKEFTHKYLRTRVSHVLFCIGYLTMLEAVVPQFCALTVPIWFPNCTTHQIIFFQEPFRPCIRALLPPPPASTKIGSAALGSWTLLSGTARATWPTGWCQRPGVTWGTALGRGFPVQKASRAATVTRPATVSIIDQSYIYI